MYNGIGLQTPRGSGTNGHVQRNWATVRKTQDRVNYRTEDEIAKLDAAANRQPNREILDHERKRKIEVKCAEYEDTLEEQGLPREEIAARVASFRAKVSEAGVERDVPKDEYGRISVKETHAVAEAQQQKNLRLRDAFGIPSRFVDGSSLDAGRQRYQLVRTPSAERDAPEAAVNKKKRSASPEAKKSKKKKSKKSKKEKKESKKKKRSKSTSDSDTSSDSASETEHQARKRKRKKKSRSRRQSSSHEASSRESSPVKASKRPYSTDKSSDQGYRSSRKRDNDSERDRENCDDSNNEAKNKSSHQIEINSRKRVQSRSPSHNPRERRHKSREPRERSPRPSGANRSRETKRKSPSPEPISKKSRRPRTPSSDRDNPPSKERKTGRKQNHKDYSNSQLPEKRRKRSPSFERRRSASRERHRKNQSNRDSPAYDKHQDRSPDPQYSARYYPEETSKTKKVQIDWDEEDKTSRRRESSPEYRRAKDKADKNREFKSPYRVQERSPSRSNKSSRDYSRPEPERERNSSRKEKSPEKPKKCKRNQSEEPLPKSRKDDSPVSTSSKKQRDDKHHKSSSRGKSSESDTSISPPRKYNQGNNEKIKNTKPSHNRPSSYKSQNKIDDNKNDDRCKKRHLSRSPSNSPQKSADKYKSKRLVTPEIKSRKLERSSRDSSLDIEPRHPPQRKLTKEQPKSNTKSPKISRNRLTPPRENFSSEQRKASKSNNKILESPASPIDEVQSRDRQHTPASNSRPKRDPSDERRSKSKDSRKSRKRSRSHGSVRSRSSSSLSYSPARRNPERYKEIIEKLSEKDKRKYIKSPSDLQPRKFFISKKSDRIKPRMICVVSSSSENESDSGEVSHMDDRAKQEEQDNKEFDRLKSELLQSFEKKRLQAPSTSRPTDSEVSAKSTKISADIPKIPDVEKLLDRKISPKASPVKTEDRSSPRNMDISPDSVAASRSEKAKSIDRSRSSSRSVSTHRTRSRSRTKSSRSRSRSYRTNSSTSDRSRSSSSSSYRSRTRSRSSSRSTASSRSTRSSRTMTGVYADYHRSRTATRSRSPSIPRRAGSPSFLDRRRITSARKRPIPYRRPTPSSESSDDSAHSPRSCRSWSPTPADNTAEED